MSFVLPKDGNQVPFIGNLDNNNFVAVPTEQYVKIGGLYVPVSQSNPLPMEPASSSSAFGDVVTITTTNTAQQLPNVSAKSKVTLIGLKGNAGTVYLGFASTVTNTTHYFAALDQKDSIDLEIANLDMVYIYGASGDGVSYVAV